MMRVLITGGTGFICGAVAGALRTAGHDVLAPTRAELDLTGAWEATFDPGGPIDAIVHGAAARDRALDAPERWPTETAINVAGTARLFEWARAASVPHIVHVSTISVLRAVRRDADLLEEDSATVTAPAHPYAMTKRWSEELALSMRKHFRSMAVVRPGSVFGPGMSPTSSWVKIGESLARGDEYPIGAPRGHKLSPVYIDDVVDVLVRSVEVPDHRLLNVVGPSVVDEAEVIEDIARRFGVEAKLAPREIDVVSVACSTKRIDELFPSRTKTSWKETVARSFAPA